MPKYPISPLAAKYAAWSFSKAGVALSCPAQFKHKYVLKTASAPSTTDANIGIAAHSILEFLTGGASYAESRKIALEKTPLTSSELEELHMFEDAILAFMKRFDMFCKRNNVVEVLREADWAFDADFNPCAFFDKNAYFRGKVDLAMKTAAGDLFIIDHKSGSAKDLTKDYKKRQQLNSYAVLALASVPDIGGVRAGIHFLQTQDIPFMDYVRVDDIRKRHVPWLFDYLNDAAEACADPFPAKAKMRWPCEWCGYQAACPAFAELMGASQS